MNLIVDITRTHLDLMVDGDLNSLATGDFIICKYCDSGPESHFLSAHRITKTDDGSIDMLNIRYFESLKTDGLFKTERHAFGKVLDVYNKMGDIATNL